MTHDLDNQYEKLKSAAAGLAAQLMDAARQIRLEDRLVDPQLIQQIQSFTDQEHQLRHNLVQTYQELSLEQPSTLESTDWLNFPTQFQFLEQVRQAREKLATLKQNIAHQELSDADRESLESRLESLHQLLSNPTAPLSDEIQSLLQENHPLQAELETIIQATSTITEPAEPEKHFLFRPHYWVNS